MDPQARKVKFLKVWGLSELEVKDKINQISWEPGLSVKITCDRGEVHVQIESLALPDEVEKKIETAEERIREKLGDNIFGCDEETMEKVVGELLMQRKITLSLAESCSGGLVSHRITNVPGISKCYLCGVVSYSNESKSMFLKVPPELIKERGAVSPEVALKMAEGIKQVTGADLSVGITGIAGPSGGSSEKPVGLVYIALSTKEGTIVRKNIFSGDRETIKWKTSQTALDLLRRFLLGKITIKS